MMIGWVKNVISSIFPAEGHEQNQIGEGAQAFEKKAKAKLIDITEGISIAEEARKKSLQLLSMVRKGGATLDRFRLWINIRRKTKRGLADFYDMPEMMEEVTEKILEAAEHDPFYKRLFR